MQFSRAPYQAILSVEQRMYKEQLYKKIGQTDDLGNFISLIEQELKDEFNILSWAFTPLNVLPILSIRNYLGNLEDEYMQIYSEKRFFKTDLILQHVKRSDDHIFQSDVEQGLRSLPFIFDHAAGYEKLMRLNHQFEYHDTCSIPITISRGGNRAVLIVVSKGLDPCSFKNIVSNRIDHLKTFALTVTEALEKNHPHNFFPDNIKRLVTLSKSDSLNTLRTMVEEDLSVEETAKYINIPLSTVKKRLKRIKDILKAKTNHGAYSRAIKMRLIE